MVMDFDQLYKTGSMQLGEGGLTLDTIPWRLDGPQPIVIELADTGQITGPVLECGCGLGDNALFLAERGHQVTAIDAAPTVIEQDRAKASERGFAVDFRVADATRLDGITGGFNTVLDSAMMHCLTDEQRRDYLAAAHRVTEPGARLHALCFTDGVGGTFQLPGHTDEASLRRDLGEHWRVERMEKRHYTTGLSTARWHELMPPAALFPVDFGQADAQGRVLLPIWQITAIRA
ncbi:MAG TPA: class I SAM-dependent methyltransferase [Pseudonocardiaceae bacterium]|jgi:SAM-dependent methyltransferase|nr:class I SAM-dependent methyltransferase [Pseudonocardiaceae bacterium]